MTREEKESAKKEAANARWKCKQILQNKAFERREKYERDLDLYEAHPPEKQGSAIDQKREGGRISCRTPAILEGLSGRNGNDITCETLH